MIDVKQAVQSVVNYMKQLPLGEEATNLALEELELTSDGRFWMITMVIHRTHPRADKLPR